MDAKRSDAPSTLTPTPDEDATRAVRGIALGVACSLGFWVTLAVAVLALLHH